jgi:hypothetical protein
MSSLSIDQTQQRLEALREHTQLAADNSVEGSDTHGEWLESIAALDTALRLLRAQQETSSPDWRTGCREMLRLLTNTSSFDQAATAEWMRARRAAVEWADAALAEDSPSPVIGSPQQKKE